MYLSNCLNLHCLCRSAAGETPQVLGVARQYSSMAGSRMEALAFRANPKTILIRVEIIKGIKYLMS